METGLGLGGGIIGAAGIAILIYAPNSPEFQIVCAVGGILAAFGVFVLALAFIFL